MLKCYIIIYFTLLLGVLKISKKELQVNEEIKNENVRVIGENGEQLGLLPIEEALELAFSKNLDLVKIAPTAKPPVCKIMDYGKFKFEQTKKEKEAKKNQRVVEVKEIRLTINIGENDFNTKVKNALKFLKAGNRVKVTVRFRGREMARTSLGYELLEKFLNSCQELGTQDKPAKLEGRNIVLLILPKTTDTAKQK